MSADVNVKYERPDRTQVHQSCVRDVAVSEVSSEPNFFSFFSFFFSVNHGAEPLYFIRIKNQHSHYSHWRSLIDFHMNVFLIGCRSALCVTASNSKWFLCLVFFFFFFPPVCPFNSSKSHSFRGSSRWKAKYDKRLVSLLANGSEGHIFPWLRLDWKLKKKNCKNLHGLTFSPGDFY